MKWVDSTDLRIWADRLDCQHSLPLLARKLIRATAKSISYIHFPSGESVLLGGWDGVLITDESSEKLPLGLSLWEFGANKKIKEKAESDYQKRSHGDCAYDRSSSTFIFVTPRLWNNRNVWIKEKFKDGIWKDIRVYNSEILEEWLEIAPTVSAWLAVKHILKYPETGIQSTEDYWDEWSRGPKITIDPKLLLGGREEQFERYCSLMSTPNVTYIQGTSRDEATAFIVASFKNSKDKEEDFFSRSLIVDSPDVFRVLARTTSNLILIARFEDSSICFKAIDNDHNVIIPIGVDSNSVSDRIIKLNQLDRNKFIQALKESGINDELAERYSKETARNITILRRRLGFDSKAPVWADKDIAREVIPLLIIGKWDENCENDRNIVAQIAQEDYDKFVAKLSRWLHSSDAPVIKAGNQWRLSSPLDAWMNASKYIVIRDLELLKNCFLQVLSEIDPSLDIEAERRYMAAVLGKTRQYSNWIREGLTQSLILISLYGNQLAIPTPCNCYTWVDNIIKDLMDVSNIKFIQSIDHELPLIAEASPTAFLNKIEKLLQIDGSPASEILAEHETPIFPISYHTGLLWALEGLAWNPIYLPQVSVLLTKLAALDRGGRIANRPINSLKEIFKSWHYQTLASFSDRMQVIDLIMSKDKNVGFELVLSMLPENFGVASPTHKMRWRLFDEYKDVNVSYIEVWETMVSIAKLLTQFSEFDDNQLSDLIKSSVHLPDILRDPLLDSIKKNTEKHNEYFITWNAIRKLLCSHRSFPNTEWALNETELLKYSDLFEQLKPDDELKQIMWIFEESWPDVPEGRSEEKISYEEFEKTINERRTYILKSILEKYGLSRIIEMINDLSDSWILGNVLGQFDNNKSDVIIICELVRDINKFGRFIQGYISIAAKTNGTEWVFDIYHQLLKTGMQKKLIAIVLAMIEPSKQLWDFLEDNDSDVNQEYWLNVRLFLIRIPVEHRVLGLSNLISHKRYKCAIQACAFVTETIPSNILVEILEKAATVKSNKECQLSQHEIEEVFSSLNSRSDVDALKLIKLELLYLSSLSVFDDRGYLKKCHELLCKEPVFYIEAIKIIHKPDDDKYDIDINNEMTNEEKASQFDNAYKLLNSWKSIPGTDEDGKIDFDFLNQWISDSRELAKSCNRINGTDLYIGSILSRYPQSNDTWPCIEICEIIESCSSNNIFEGFKSGIRQRHSSSLRGAFDGGDIERNIANFYSKNADFYKMKYPNVTSSLIEIAFYFLERAKFEDERAERDKLDY